MPGEPIRLGPFIGGLNTASDPSVIDDTELAECTNFELDLDGSLRSRPPIFAFDAASAFLWTQRMKILGIGTWDSGSYLFGATSTGLYHWEPGAANWTRFAAGTDFFSTSMVQYADKVWFIPHWSSDGYGVSWDPVTTVATQPTFPKGGKGVIFKERLFIVPGPDATTNTTRLTFSEPGTLDVAGGAFPPSNFFDIGQGDGQKLIDVISFNDKLILFKTDSTYVLSYSGKPESAELVRISSSIGATKPNCVVQFENSVFVYHEGSVYEIINYEFVKINRKVPFEFDGAAPSTRIEDVFISLFGERLIVRYHNRLYVYGLRTKTWSTWESLDENLHNFGPLVAYPSNSPFSVNYSYYGGSSILSNTKIYRINDGYDAVTSETIVDGSIPVPPPPGSLNTTWETLSLSKWEELDNYTWAEIQDGSYLEGSGGPVTDPTATPGTTIETPASIRCRVRTKNFDIGVPHKFKKLFWWGADLISSRQYSVLGRANPITTSFDATWYDLSNYTWEQLEERTWGNLLSESPSVETVIDTNLDIVRKFTKFLKTLRFRQINFEVELYTSGSLVDGPCRVLSMTAIILSKQKVTQKVN